MPYRRFLTPLFTAAVAALAATPAAAHTPAAADVTEAVGFAGGATTTRACTGTLAVVPSASVTTFPPSAGVNQLVVARSTCAGNLAGGTAFNGRASFINVGFYRNSVQLSNTSCYADECVLPVPANVDYVLADFHWSLASGFWSVQEPGACVPGATPQAIRCTAATGTYL